MLPLHSLSYSLPYILVFILLYVVALPVTTRQGALVNRVPQVQFLFLVLFFFIGLRGYIAWDWKNYFSFWELCPTFQNGFPTVGDFLFNHHWEKGFVLYSILLKSISTDWFFFQSISFFIDFCVLYVFFYKYIPKHILLAFCFWYIISGFLGMNFSVDLQRNGKSLLFFLFSIKYIEQKDFFRYSIFNCIGSLFHVSSVLYIPLYFIFRKKWDSRLILILFIFGNIVYFFQIKWMIPILELVSDIIGGRIGAITEYYVDSAFHGSKDVFSIGFLECTLIFIAIFKFRYKLILMPAHGIFFNALCLQMFSYLYLSEMRVVMERISVLFAFANWILLPRLYCVLKKDYKSLFLIAVLCYSILKIWVNTRFVSYKYDNMFFQQLSTQERIQLQQLLLHKLNR